MPTKQERAERLNTQTSTDIVELYSSFELGEIIKKLSLEYSIKNIPSFVYIIGDTILGFHKTSELPELLQKEVGVSADDAQQIVRDLSEFLAPVITLEKMETGTHQAEPQEPQRTLTSKLHGTQEEKDSTPFEHPETVVPKNVPESTAQEKHSPVQTMRTMEGDMSRIHGYGAYRAQFPEETQGSEYTEQVIRSASQEDLLQEKPKLTEMPTYEEKE